jgi:hypothetical protein
MEESTPCLVDIRGREHPITRGMTAFMAKTDELNAGLFGLPAGSFHVLATGFDKGFAYPKDYSTGL